MTEEHPFVEYCKLLHDFYMGRFDYTIGVKRVNLKNGDKCCILQVKERMIIMFKIAKDIQHWLFDGDCEQMSVLHLHGGDYGKVNTKILECFGSLNNFVINIVDEYLNEGLKDFQPSMTKSGKIRQRSIGSSEYRRITIFDYDRKNSLDIQKYTSNSFGVSTATCVFLGSSLAGGIAMVSALNAALIYKCANIECYTFGCPKIGDRIFAKFMREEIPNIMCLTHRYDIVPDLPIIGFFIGFIGFADKKDDKKDNINYYPARYISKVLIDIHKRNKYKSKLLLYLKYILKVKLDFLLKYNNIELYLKIIQENYKNKKDFVAKWGIKT